MMWFNNNMRLIDIDMDENFILGLGKILWKSVKK